MHLADGEFWFCLLRKIAQDDRESTAESHNSYCTVRTPDLPNCPRAGERRIGTPQRSAPVDVPCNSDGRRPVAASRPFAPKSPCCPAKFQAPTPPFTRSKRRIGFVIVPNSSAMQAAVGGGGPKSRVYRWSSGTQHGQRCFRIMQNRPRTQRNLMPTTGRFPAYELRHPIRPPVPTSRAHEAVTATLSKSAT
jgi:hypothetical protein